MKLKAFLILTACSCLIGQKTGAQITDKTWSFSDLYFSESKSGEVNLFYQEIEKTEYYCTYYDDYLDSSITNFYTDYESTVHHLNLETNSDSVFIRYLQTFPVFDCTGGGGIYVHDFHPFDGDIKNSIFAGMLSDGFEPYGFLQIGNRSGFSPLFAYFKRVYSNPKLSNTLFVKYDYERTIQLPITTNPDTINAIHNYWYDPHVLKDYANIYDFQLGGISSFKDSLIFFKKDDAFFISEDLGKTSDTLDISIEHSRFYFDQDSLHIYLFSKFGSALRSNLYGKPGSWQPLLLPNETRLFRIDPKLSGYIYIADSTKIYESSDFGNSFEIIHEFNEPIIDFYKKSSEDIFYVMLSDKIIEKTGQKTQVRTIVSEIPEVKLNTKNFAYKTGDIFVFRVYERKNGRYEPVEDFKMVVEEGFFKQASASVVRLSSNTFRKMFTELRISPVGDVFSRSLDQNDTEFLLFKNNHKLYNPWLSSISDNNEEKELGIYRSHNRSYYHGVYDSLSVIQFYVPENNDTLKKIGSNKLRVDWSNFFGFRNISFGDTFYGLKGSVISGTVYGDTTRTLRVSNEETPELPKQITLHQNYPNPFNPTTTIQFELVKPAFTQLTVYDALGRKIRTLIEEQRPAGLNSIPFDASELASGVYLYRLEADGLVQTRKMLLIK